MPRSIFLLLLLVKIKIFIPVPVPPRYDTFIIARFEESSKLGNNNRNERTA